MMSRLPPGVHTIGAVPGAIRQTPMQTAFASTDLLRDMNKVFEEASRANTSVYTLDPRGLGEEYSAEDALMNVPVDRLREIEDERRRLQSESADVLRTIADQTDGRHGHGPAYRGMFTEDVHGSIVLRGA